MADDKLEWVFDSLVEFLRGPIWNIPVLTFIEQKSVVFEPGAENEEEFKKIHEAYKNLVDFMLGSYMEDLEISPEEFEKSCSVVSSKVLNQFHQSLFQQVWAADDFEIFKRMMTQKNLELQLQALEFLTQKRGSVPDCMEPVGKIHEEKEMEDIIKKAIAESESHVESETLADTVLQEQIKQVAEKEKELLEQAIQQSVLGRTSTNSNENSVQEEEIKETEEEESMAEIKEFEEKMNESAEGIKESEDTKEPEGTDNNALVDPTRNGSILKNESESSDDKFEKLNIQTPNVDSPEENIRNDVDKNAKEIMTIKIEETPLKNILSQTPSPLKASEERPWSEGDSSVYNNVQAEVSPLELEKRQNYLRQQRDRILALKKQERARRLSSSEEIVQSRPKSARAAKKMLREERTEIDPQTLAFRKTLAAKLRNEVVDKSD